LKHKIRNRTRKFEGRAFNVEILDVDLPDGRQREYDLVDHPNSVTIIPVDNDGNIYFVKQYRMGSESALLELPAGVMNEHESPQKCAAREIREETGMAAGLLTRIGAVYLAPGYSNEMNFIFLAKELTEDPLQEDEDEFISIHAYSPGDVQRMIRSGEIQDSKTLAALYFMQLTQLKQPKTT
jgi:ADP-ribose pyrophosphatase